MGGRGKSSDINTRQISFDRILLTQDITRIRGKADAIRASMDFSSGAGGITLTKRKQCYCCGEYTILKETEYETCPICGWIDDEFQNTHPDSLAGRNPVCLNDARDAYRKSYESEA